MSLTEYLFFVCWYYSALDRATIGGLTGLVETLLSHGIDPNAQTRSDKRTALHWALAYGRLQIARLLVAHGADLHLADAHGSTPHDFLSNPGTISATDALLFFNITQRPVRTIGRLIHPESTPTNLTDRDSNLRAYYRGWPGGTGGWGEERLTGYQDDMHCEVDQYWADEITGDEIYRRYFLRNAPLLIRGLIHEWPAVTAYAKDELNQTYGKFGVTVSDIPYAEKFGGAAAAQMSLSDYIDEVRSHRILGGRHPWYVFKGHVVRSMEEKSSLVPWTLVPTPQVMQDAFNEVLGISQRPDSDRANFRSRNIFINAQWAFGGEGTGAPG